MRFLKESSKTLQSSILSAVITFLVHWHWTTEFLWMGGSTMTRRNLSKLRRWERWRSLIWHLCCLTSNGRVFIFGENNFGQFGDGITKILHRPKFDWKRQSRMSAYQITLFCSPCPTRSMDADSTNAFRSWIMEISSPIWMQIIWFLVRVTHSSCFRQKLVNPAIVCFLYITSEPNRSSLWEACSSEISACSSKRADISKEWEAIFC